MATTFRDDAITATEQIIDALGTPGCVYIPLTGVQTTITAVVEFGTFTIEAENGSYTVHQARLMGKIGDFPNAAEGDVLRYNSGTVDAPVYEDYCLYNPENDGIGQLSAWLTIA